VFDLQLLTNIKRAWSNIINGHALFNMFFCKNLTKISKSFAIYADIKGMEVGSQQGMVKMNTQELQESELSVFARSMELIEGDPLEEIFALNLGEYLSEILISDDLIEQISATIKEQQLV